MLNYLWGYMILIGIGFGILTGEVEALSNAAIDSTGEAVTMAITMLGIMSMWTGLIEIAKRSGLLDQITRKLDPVLVCHRRCFPVFISAPMKSLPSFLLMKRSKCALSKRVSW